MTRRLLRHDASEIRDRRPGVQAGEHVIAARVTRQLVDARVAVVEIAEDDRFGRARLLAGGHDVAIADVAILESRLILRATDALHAERALFHHALLAHRDIRVEQHRQRLGPRFPLAATLRVVVPVEVADLVRAVVGAVARADATVVDLAVEAVGRVVGGVDRTDRLARRVAALLAQHRRIDGALRHACLIGQPVALDPHPRHLAAALHQLLTHRRQVVFGVAGGDARRAAGALRQVDGQAPARMVARIVADRGLFVLALAPPLDGVLRILGRFLVMERVTPVVQGLGSGQAQHFHRALTALAWAPFRRDDLAMLARFRRARAHGKRAPAVTVYLGAKQLEGVRGTILRVASVGAVPLPGGYGQDVRPHRVRDPGGG